MKLGESVTIPIHMMVIQEYRDILKIVEERILGKGVYDGLESEC